MNSFFNILKTAFVFMLLACAPTLNASHLSPEDALRRATDSKGSFHKVKAASSYRLKYSLAADGSDVSDIYVFGNDSPAKGFIIVSADDCAEALLGYADGVFDADAMPPAMKWWLGEYARQIAADRSAGTRKIIGRPQREAIAPMLKTKWNQDAPYNLMCPVINGNRAMTGCVATAMAQITKYHEWPETGTGYYQYYYNGDWISLDFSKITYDWKNMLDTYSGVTSSERQKIAVAQLMYACGVSTDMQYSPMESGTADVFVASALADYFNYDRNIRYAERDYFGMLEWEDFIYQQLKNYGPVQYSGSSTSGGHSFVCDGYSEDGYFHFNWGWGGVSDGYFLLSALDPPIQGIGGASAGFNFYQAVIANIRKPRANSQMYLNLMMDQGFSVQTTKTNGTRPGDQVLVNRRIVNYSIGEVYGSLGLKFTEQESGEVKYSTAGTRFDMPALTPLQSYSAFLPAALRTGTYEITPVMCGTDGVWKPIPVKLSCNQKMIMTVKNGLCTFAEDNGGSVTVTDVELHTPVYLGNLFRLSATVNNPGTTEFVGQLVPTLATGHTPVAKADPLPVDILPGESTQIEITGIFNHFSSSTLPSPGTYTLYLVKEATNEIVSEGLSVELHGIPENTLITVEDFALEGDNENVDPSNLIFTGKVSCAEGYIGRNLDICIFPYASGNLTSIAYFSTPYLFLSSGESSEFTAGGKFGAAEAGQTYFAVIFDGDNLVTKRGEELFFTISKQTSAAGIERGGNIVLTRVYNTLGALIMESDSEIDTANVPVSAGIYIIETVAADGSRSVRRVMLR